MAETPIGWYVTFRLKASEAGAFRRIADGVSAAVEKTEPGTLFYQWFLSDDEKTGHCSMWFDSKASALKHITGVAPSQHLPKLLEVGEIARFDVFGTPSPELAKILDAFPVTSRNAHVVGFAR